MSDQACSPTIRCTVCLPEFDSGRQPQRPFLVKIGRYWRCPVCGANYGTCPDPRLQGRRTMPLGLSDKQRRLIRRINPLSTSRAIHLRIPPGFMPGDRGCAWYIRAPYYEQTAARPTALRSADSSFP